MRLPIPPAFLHDEWIALIAAAAGRVACIDRPLVGYRQHAGQAIRASASSLVVNTGMRGPGWAVRTLRK